jgi:beta-hydroxylase
MSILEALNRPFGWSRPTLKRARRIGIGVAVLALAIYFVPWLAAFYLVCGALDIGRQHKITYELIEKYFLGNGILTWLLSPINLLADLLCYRNRLVYRLEDMPPGHRQEIETCVREFVANGDRIKAHVEKKFGENKRCMLTFQWFGAVRPTDVDIPAFTQKFQYIRTVAISAFNTRERTSRHFGPARFTLRVLYNLDPAKSSDVFIEADNVLHYWSENPLFIFDDTIFHRSVNDIDQPRYCLFMDIVRPTPLPGVLNVMVSVAALISGSFARLFYKNWAFIR